MDFSNVCLGAKLAEGKTKEVFELTSHPGYVLLLSKDRITANNAMRSDDLEGKAAISTDTTCKIFEFLQKIGVRSHFVVRNPEVCNKSFIAKKCEMIPIEWVTRRVATGSFLKRNPRVKEGFRFTPVKMETFFKDDAAGDPQWSKEEILSHSFCIGGRKIGLEEYEIMSRITVLVFEVLEKAWASLDCSLIDMKIEFGVDVSSGDILLADVIDSDSWRLWPSGDKRLMKDKQVYRDLAVVTNEALQEVKRNFQWIADQLPRLFREARGQVVVFMGSPSDLEFCKKIQTECHHLGIECELRVTSAHKSTEDALKILAQYEGGSIPTVFIAVAGRSNGLGPVLSGNTCWPVINCPPVNADWGAQDVWSSLRLPSGLGCSTVLSPEAAALQAAQILALTDHMIWSRLRARQAYTCISLTEADRKARKENLVHQGAAGDAI